MSTHDPVEICAHMELSYCCCCGNLSSSQLHPTLMRNHSHVQFHRYFCAQIKKGNLRTNFKDVEQTVALLEFGWSIYKCSVLVIPSLIGRRETIPKFKCF